MLDNILNSYPDETFLKADGFDAAIVGLDDKEMRLIYDVDKCLEILGENMNPVEAREYFEFNVKGAYVGEQTPIFMETF